MWFTASTTSDVAAVSWLAQLAAQLAVLLADCARTWSSEWQASVGVYAASTGALIWFSGPGQSGIRGPNTPLVLWPPSPGAQSTVDVTRMIYRLFSYQHYHEGHRVLISYTEEEELFPGGSALSGHSEHINCHWWTKIEIKKELKEKKKLEEFQREFFFSVACCTCNSLNHF